MKKPLISVVIPTYNRVFRLIESVDSVLAQTVNDLEIIIVSDGSKDETGSVVKKMTDKRIRFWQRPHLGPATSRNFGINKARGKYLAFCDDDDSFLPGKLKLQLSFMERQSQLAFCFTNGYIMGDGKKKKFMAKLRQRSFLELLLENSQILTPTVLARTAIIKKYKGFNAHIQLCEDYDLWLRIARDHSFDFIDKPLVAIGKHSANISANGQAMFRAGVAVKLHHLKKYHGDIPINIRRRFEWTLAYQQGKFYFFQNKMTKARRFFGQASRLLPFNARPPLMWLYTFFGQKAFDHSFIPLYQNLLKKSYSRGWETLD